jgi:hypothetical protein
LSTKSSNVLYKSGNNKTLFSEIFGTGKWYTCRSPRS